QADVSPRMADNLVEKLHAAYKDREIKSTDEVMLFLKEHLKSDFPPQNSASNWAPRGTPTVILVVGVNGSGKTTSIAKLAHRIKKKLPSAPHEVLLVLDGNTGQTAVRQAKNFERTAGVTGLIVTKLDGTAKGGAVISMRAEVDLPVKWIGLGEKMTDIEPFDADLFVDEIFKTEEEAAAAE